MSHPYVSFNGQLIEQDQLNLGMNRAFKFGDGLFETIKIINGKPQLMPQHIARLIDGMMFLKLDTESSFSMKLTESAEKLILKNQIKQGGVLRIFVYRSGKGKYSPESNKAEVLMETESSAEPHYKLNEVGLRIDIAESMSIQSSYLANIKSLNALPYIKASIEKQERTFDDLILLNEQDQLVEATSSNVFLLYGKTLHTPPLSSGCLNGVMRKHIMEIAPKMDLVVLETELSSTDLVQADEVFLTNSLSGIQWVGAFRKKRYFHNCSQKIVELL